MSYDSMPPNETNNLEKHLKKYQEALLQVNKRNRSVLYKKTYNKHNFDLATLLDFNNKICEMICQNSIQSSSALHILSNTLTGDDVDVSRNKLKQLSQNLKLIEDETGQQTGFVGFPFVQGHADADFFIRGPLVLFPVNLELKKQTNKGGWYINFLTSGPIFNGALLTAIKKRSEIDFPKNIDETFDEIINDMMDYDKPDILDEFFRRITVWIKNIIPIDDTLNNFKLQKIHDMSKQDIDGLDQEKFHLLNHVVTGNFPQADNEIYKDYGKLLKSDFLDMGPIADLFDINDPEYQDDAQNEDAKIHLDDTPDEKLNLVLDSDSSQDMVILRSKQSTMTVVRGPPGTGKSQVITNLISDALSNSQKVLVVCQKRAALDVVHQRLGKVGLDKFVLVIGMGNQDRKKMYEQIYNIIEDPGYDSQNNDLSSISKQINDCVQKLSSYATILHKPYFGGITIQELYSTAQSNYQPKLDLKDLGFKKNRDQLDDFFNEFCRMEELFKKTALISHPWSHRRTFCDATPSTKSTILKTLDSLLDHLSNSIIVKNSKRQDLLVSQLDKYLNSRGFLSSLKQKKHAKTIKNILGISKITPEYVKDHKIAIENGVNFWENLLHLSTFFIDLAQDDLNSLSNDSEKLKVKLESLKRGLADFDNLQAWDMKSRDAPDVAKMLLMCKEKFSPDDDWKKIFEQEIYFSWIDFIESENPILRGNPISEYEENKKTLAQLIINKKEIVTKHIQSKIASSVVPSTIKGKSTNDRNREWKEFSKELRKKSKVKPIRQLFEKYPDNFLQIAPCWLASPESVSKIFPLKRNLFDLVIVDEASQLAVERALPFLFRSKNVVIAGDEKQLQPFDLFQIKDNDEDDDDEVVDEKSLLETAIVHHPPMQLAWHYRSKYQDLIDFSNHAFYNGKLQIAPNVRTDPEHPPIKWIKCDGIWQLRQNHQEAQLVLDEINNIWRNAEHDYPTIGVITFNDEQRDLIHNQFEKKIDEDAEFARLYAMAVEGKGVDEKPFFKNIENVQGDERDVIIFSIGYAKDDDGNFTNQFGTLSKPGGENRLNVAITRAKEHMVIVSSIDSVDIKETSKNLGPRRLREFLEYAKASAHLDKAAVKNVLAKVTQSTASKNNPKIFDSPFEKQVYAKLTKRGYTIHTQVGVSGYSIDLAVVHPDHQSQYLLGIECDGATYHSAPSAKERDVMRQKFLESKGWKFERIWSRNWWKDPEEVISGIVARIEEELKL